ncbi:ATP-binding cassette domain-containing protein [Candidatus Poribacteria bacterium]|nr:ATP-binding cassette domain-containing protein [Candidatus Poribacteria bacterium]
MIRKGRRVIYEIEGLSFRYRNGDFSLNIEEMIIEEDGITGIVGPSGSGKTTLLLNLAFLLVGRWREFKFEGHRVELENLRSPRRRVTYVPQNPVLFTGTAESNILYPLKLRGIGGREARHRGSVWPEPWSSHPMSSCSMSRRRISTPITS